MKLSILLSLTLLLALASVYVSPVQGQQSPIQVLSAELTSEFPEGMRFKLEVQSDSEITSVAARFRVGQRTRGVYDYLEFELTGEIADSELFWRTNTSARYIPPGTIITYNFEIDDADGNRLETEPQEFIYFDARFTWDEVSDGPISVAFHGPVRTRAQAILDAMLETFDNMGPLLGADTSVPVRVTMYNNVKEMLEALPPGSTTIRRELITEGQAFVDVGTLLVHANSRRAKGTASREMIHILTHRAGDSLVRNVPQWLDEGLSEFGNVEPGFSYDIALEFAIANDRLLPITSLQSLPGNPEDVIIFYGQGSSIVRFMVFQFGPDTMTELMTILKSGTDIDEAIQEVYGISRLELENQWRILIGAPEISLEERERVAPTAIPRAAILPYSLTPQANSQSVTSTTSESSTNAGTLQPQRVDTPTPAPTSTPLPTPTPEPVAQATTVPAAPSNQEQAAGPTGGTSDSEQPQTGGGSCSLPLHGGAGMVEMSSLAMLLGLVGLGLRRRFRK